MPRSLPKRPRLRVGISEFPPFVELGKTEPHGFEIALWRVITKYLDVDTEFVSSNLRTLIQRAHQGRIDVGMAGLSKTEAREALIDFTHTTYKSGLHILVPSTIKVRIWSSFVTAIKDSWRQLVGLFLSFSLFVTAMAHLIWYIERGHNFPVEYVQGVGDGIWYVIVTISTVGYGDITPVTFWGRMLGIFLIIAGYTIFALVVAQLNSIFVYQKLQTQIQDPGDLHGKRVVTVKGTVSEDLLEKYRPIITPAEHLSGALLMLEKGKADALVFDAPVLQHYLKIHGNKKFRIVGTRFEEHDYGLILPENSPWTEKINRTLLHIIESGEYDALYRQWFKS